MDANAFQIIGFLLAAYSVVANDSLQTLGTYLSSNKGRTPKALQMLFICGVAAAVLLIGWFLHPAGGGLVVVDRKQRRVHRSLLPQQALGGMALGRFAQSIGPLRDVVRVMLM